MSHIKKVRKDIQSRRYYQARSVKSHHPVFSLIYGLIMILMLVASLTLGYLINEKHQFIQVGQFVNRIVTTLSLDSISTWIPFEKWFPATSKVAQVANYQLIKDDFYTNNSNQAHSIMDGVVLYISTQESGQIVMIKHDNGVIATYGAMDQISVKENERILKGKSIGSYQEALYMEFTLNGNKVSYEESLINHEN